MEQHINGAERWTAEQEKIEGIRDEKLDTMNDKEMESRTEKVEKKEITRWESGSG